MNKIIALLALLFSFQAVGGEIIFPKDDPFEKDKQEIIQEILEVMGPGNALEYVLDSSKVLLWANSAKVLKKYGENNQVSYEATHQPNFAAVTEENEPRLRAEMERLCGCSLKNKEIAGILTANPYLAARMYFRQGWNNYTGEEIDGFAPPIVIIYHELAHVKDYLMNAQFFFDMAGTMDKRWKNLAEKSAVMQQNDFVFTLAAKKKLYFDRRRSYGQNTLYWVSGFYDVGEERKFSAQSAQYEGSDIFIYTE